ncbi:MAG TPA: lipid II flippase MurJ, partial [Acidimicrobiales bacterium]|nr:lipid II flippase MurJ [Acidimicrobiales bacterium]
GIEPLLKSVLTLAFGHSIGINALIIGNLTGSATAAAVLWCRVHHLGLRVRLRTAFLTPFVRGVAATTAPLIISQSVLQTNPVLDRAMAGQLGAGSVTGLDLGLRLCVIPAALLTTLMTTPLTVTWTETKLHGGWEALRPNVASAIVTVATIVPPLVAVGFVLRRQIVSFVYQGGAYSPHALSQTSGVFGMILLSLPAQVVIFMLVTLFVIEKETIFPMLVGITNVVLNAALNFALRPYLGVEGIALSTTLTAIILCGAYIVAAQRRWGALRLAGRWQELVVATVATLLAGAAAIGLVGLLPAPTSRLRALVAVALGGGLALAAYAVVALARGRTLVGTVRTIRSTIGLEA